MSFSATTKNISSVCASQPCAYRVLGLLPVLSSKANAHRPTEWKQQRRLRLFQECLNILVGKIIDYCSKDYHYLYSDGKTRITRPFMHFLLTDGLEASVNANCPTTNCLSCWCPAERLDDTKVQYQFENEKKSFKD